MCAKRAWLGSLPCAHAADGYTCEQQAQQRPQPQQQGRKVHCMSDLMMTWGCRQHCCVRSKGAAMAPCMVILGRQTLHGAQENQVC
jgi:hypothetical protein